MTREEAKRELLFAKREVMADSYIDKAYDMAIKALEQPERKRGVWLPDNNNYITPHFVCSACGMSQKVETVMYKPIWAFCPRCGARMMEGERND